MRPQPLSCDTDVERSCRWYQAVLDCESGHGGDEYERLLYDGTLVMQLHRFEVEHEAQRAGGAHRGLAHLTSAAALVVGRAVGAVKARAVDPGLDEAVQHAGVVGRGAQRGDDLGVLRGHERAVFHPGRSPWYR